MREIFDFEVRVSQESATFWIEALTLGAVSVDFYNSEHISFNVGIQMYSALTRSVGPQQTYKFE